MHREPRTEPIDKIVVHVNVGPESGNGAHNLAAYLERIDAGYHVIADDTNLVSCARDDERVWGASGMNSRGLHICIIGYADQSPEQWHDAYSTAAIRNAALGVTLWCKKHGIPPVKLGPEHVAINGVKGICGHVDVERSGLPGTGGSAGHWDPGPHFPWDEFIALVRQMLGGGGAPAPRPNQEDDDDMPKPTDVTGVLETKYGLWHLHADGGVFTIRGQFHGSYPGLPAKHRNKPRVFYSIRERADRKPGYVLVANDGAQYAFHRK